MFYVLICFLSGYVTFHDIFNSVPTNDFGKSGKHRGLKPNTDVILYEELDGRRNGLVSATISGADMTDPDESQSLLHGVDLNRGSGYHLVVMKAAVIHTDSFLIPIPEFHSVSIDKV